MRPKLNLRNTRPVHLTIATAMLTVPASAVALTSGASAPAVAAGGLAVTPTAGSMTPLAVKVAPRRIRFGDHVTVTGTAPSADAGLTLVLETATTRRSSWRRLTATRIGRHGRFRLTAPLRESGFVKVVDSADGAVVPGANPVAIASAPTVPASAPQAVLVAAELVVAKQRSFSVLGGQPIDVSGRLLPARAGRAIRLQGRSGGHWRTLAGARTGARGGFHLRYLAGGSGGRLGAQPIRVLFAGDRLNTRSRHRLGPMTVYNQSVASWYDDAGATASGFHAAFGVANRTLPFGTRVTFRYGARTVTAVVDDRGPFVGGRDWDLNQNTAAALGFSGVDTVWSTR
jgi:rare lipoprotein A